MRALALAASAALLAVAGSACGGSRDDGAVRTEGATTEVTGAALPGWVDDALGSRFSGLVLGGSDFAVGENRITFLLVRNDGSLVQSPTAKVLFGQEDAPPEQAEATLVALGPHSHPGGAAPHDHPEATDLYVAHVEVDEPGRYWLVVDPTDETLQGVGAVDVRERSYSPALGSKAPPSQNPTLDEAPASEITTARPPDTELLRHSVADALAEHVPFVVVFATPEFCRSRTCGPTVEVVQKLAGEFDGSGIRFIHVEVYEANDPQKGYNRWMQEWNLRTEPWVFAVDGAGVVRAKFEGSVAVEELREAVREHVRTGP